MNSFWIGFISGIIANWGFAMISRILPATWVRYKINIGKPRKQVTTIGEEWFVPVRVIPPSLKRVLMNPLEEYLIAHVNVDNAIQWYRTKWAGGDVSESRLRADGAMTVEYYLLSRLGHSGRPWGIADSWGVPPLPQLPKSVRFRVIYSLDGAIASEKNFTVNQIQNDISELMV